PAGGAMAAAFADEQTVAEIIGSFGDAVTIATLNGPENTVISGAGEAVDDAVDALKAQGIKVRRLNVSHAFHSSLMEPMLPEFEQVLNEVHFSRPRMRMATNITGTFATDELSHGDYWLRQARGAVRFADDIQTLYDAGYRVFLEVGPNPTLIGMAQRIVSEGTWLTSLRANKDDWETLLNAAGSLYTVGAEPDWVAFDADYTRHKVDLPTYPFQHQRYWVKEKPYQARKAGKSAGDFGLLGEKLASPLKTIQFETVLTPEDFSFLNDHRIHGTPILPATAYMEMALEAANVLLGGGQIENLGIYDALAVPDDQARVVQMVLQPRSGNRHQFELFSQGDGEADWKLHASGDIVAGFAEPVTTETPDAIQARCDSESDAETHYARLYQSGLNFGPGLHGVQHLWHGDGEALGLIDAPEVIASEVEQYIIHPSLLDACLQVLAEAVPADVAQTDVYLPVGIGALVVHTGLTPPMFSHARVQYGASQDVLQGELTVIDEAGNVLLSLTNIRLKRASKAVLGRMGQADITNWLYQPTWQPTPLPQPLQLPSPATVQEIVQPFVVPYKDKYGQSAYDDLSPQIDSLSADYVLLALQDLGWQPAAGERFDLETLANQLGVLAQHARLFERLFGMLEADGYVQHQGSTWTVTAAIPQQDAAALDQRATGLLEAYPAFSAELTFAQRCGSHLAGALNGTVDPLQLLFPDGSFALTDNLYQKSPGARTYNALVQQAVQTLLAEVPEDRKVRILEIGAGTGGTTSFVVPDLPADRVESYTFTDISPLFGSRAAERFKAYSFMEYGVLDIKKDPLEQGFEPAQADLIIAANVIHATADLRTTLTHVRKLLAPNGTLILLEMIRPERWVDLSFGLTDGWWRFVDRDIRNDYLLMPQEGWFNVLSQCGFVEWGSIPAAGGPLPEDAVIIARAGVSENWLIFADQSGLGADLASALSSEGHHCALVEAGDAYERTSDGYMIDPSVPAHFQQLVSENPWSQVIYLWGLDAALPEDADKATLDAVQRQITGSALLLSQALLSAPARLWLVTRGAQAVDEPALEVSQSTLWGLGKAISLEHPELQPMRLDLDPEGFALEQFVALLLSPDAEDQLALRDSTRYVARLERYQPTETIDDDQPVQLTIQERGVIDNLLLTPLTRRQPGPGEVEIRVRATGLNFKDVLNVMGMYPGDAGALGGECAGEVTAVGPDVTDLQVGDAVLGMTSGAFSTYVIADAKLMVRKPANISFEQAATLPIPFITAYYALHYLGDMQAGEKVLIHAATGGVGFAAVQLAQRVGAEIYATAGTDEKRDLLHSLGVPHVMNSRTLEFAEAMQALTDGNGVDLVLNSLADEFVPASVSTLAADGRFLEIGKRGILTEAEFAQARPDADYHIIDWTPEAVHNPQLIRSILLEIMTWMEEGSLHPLPVRTFPLAEASAAFRFMAQAKHIGKIAITQQVPGEIRPDVTYLITGGLRGLGLLVAEWLVEKGARHLVLMGRQAPSEQAQETLDALTATGVQVLVARGDVSQEADVRRVMDEIEASMPPLRGVIHSAGALADAGLMAQDWAHFETVFASKVDGAWLLHQFTQALPLDFFVLFSSVASLIGSRGQANHVAENSFMDALVHYRRSLGLPGMSINWGAWGEIGAVVEHGVGERVAQQGVGLIAPSEGLEVLDLLLKNAPVQVGVSPIDWPVLLRNFTAPFFSAFAGEETDAASAAAAEAQAMPQTIGIRQQLVEMTPANRQSMLTEFVREQVAYVLGAPSAQVVDERTPMNSLGLDSLMAVELRNRLTSGLQLERPLPATLVFDYPTVLAITDFLLEMLVPASEVDDSAAPETPEPTEAAGDQVLDLLDAFETLSDEEVDRLLAQHMGQNNEEDYGDE
ncbi:MAG: SDR family NAD(P)-dependent oxidoreductase, partial [Anaerolineae bacterium]|nr:SDR family NAD(P)-dependent oxidoreductase [Anaerolineae bacterium]